MLGPPLWEAPGLGHVRRAVRLPGRCPGEPPTARTGRCEAWVRHTIGEVMGDAVVLVAGPGIPRLVVVVMVVGAVVVAVVVVMVVVRGLVEGSSR